MKVAGFLVVAFGALVAAIAAMLPATLVDRRLDALTKGKLRLAEASGTVWRGRGIASDGAGTWRMPMAWTVAMSDVLRGVQSVTLQPVDGASTPAGVVTAGTDGLRARDLRLDLPAQALFMSLPMRPLPAFGGTVSVSAQEVAWTNGTPSGSVEARWPGARVAAAGTALDLGDVTLAVAPQGDRMAGRLANTGGDVRIDGTLSLAQGRALTLDATVAPAPGAPGHVVRALAALGTPDASGAVRIAWRGNLR
jgi:general secretion pathway protein N